MQNRITPIQTDAQAAAVTQYNADKKKAYDKMPLVMRNLATGWPLLQVSLFLPCGDNKHEPMLGGGKCHELSIPQASLAVLLAQVEGRATATLGNADIKLDEFSLYRIASMVSRSRGYFTFKHINYALDIASESDGYGGNSSSIRIASEEGLGDILNGLLYVAFKKSVKPGSKVVNFDYHNHGYTFTDSDLANAVNPECAVVVDGNIFIDLGLLIQMIDNFFPRKACQEFFALIFKPEQFLALKLPVPAQQLLPEANPLEGREVESKKISALVVKAKGIAPNTPDAYEFIRSSFLVYSKADASSPQLARFFSGQWHNKHGDTIAKLLLKPEYKTFDESTLTQFLAETSFTQEVKQDTINPDGDVYAILIMIKRLAGIDYFKQESAASPQIKREDKF